MTRRHQIDYRFFGKIDQVNGNWVLANHPDAYLYGALLQSAPWLGRDDRVPLWAQAFADVLSDIAENDKTESFAANLKPVASMVI